VSSGGIFDPAAKQQRIQEIDRLTGAEDFWSDQRKAKALLQERSRLTADIEAIEALNKALEGLGDTLELAEMEGDEDLTQEIDAEIQALETRVQAMEFARMMSGDHDRSNAILTIHAGAGGTESQDWAEMLMRMYLRYAEIHKFKTDILDFQSGDEAGIKSVTIMVTGPFAYGYLKAEAGVDRLVRISPFDSNSRRHTSFASVFVVPEVDEDIDIEIDPGDLRIDTYRACGAGGQHVNKTDSAIRITHLPTGIVVQCQNERSQFKNKSTAMKILASRLYQLKLEEQRAKQKEMESSKKDIAWGSQIRSYVFHPYNMVKDHRTNVETSNIQQVMDGHLDRFIEKYLAEFGGTGN